MKSKMLSQRDGRRTFAIVFDEGDEAVAGLRDFAREQRLGGSSFSAIGAFRDAIVAYFDWERREYRHLPQSDQMEVLSLVGNVALDGDEPKVHAHAVLGRPDGRVRGGHLIEGHVRPTLEIVLEEMPRHLVRRHDPRSSLALIDLEPD